MEKLEVNEKIPERVYRVLVRLYRHRNGVLPVSKSTLMYTGAIKTCIENDWAEEEGKGYRITDLGISVAQTELVKRGNKA